jgi:hypothetical protein
MSPTPTGLTPVESADIQIHPASARSCHGRPLRGRDNLLCILFRRFRCAPPAATHGVALRATNGRFVDRKCPSGYMRKCEEYAQMLSYGYIRRFFDKKFAVIRQQCAFFSAMKPFRGAQAGLAHIEDVRSRCRKSLAKVGSQSFALCQPRLAGSNPTPLRN